MVVDNDDDHMYAYRVRQSKNGYNSIICVIVRRRSNGRLEFFMIGRRTRADVGHCL